MLLLIFLNLSIPDLSAQDIELAEYDRVQTSPCERYTVPGSTVDVWDWREERFTFHYRLGNGPVTTASTPSPFYVADYTLSPNTNFLTYGNPDYEPADGWELLYRNFGTPSEPAQEPSFGLYNRYSSLVRIFYWLTPNGEAVYQNMTFTASHVNDIFSAKSSAIFEHLNIPANALDNFDKSGLSVGQLNEVIINGAWVILEFPAAYDPCVCLHETSIEVRPRLSSISTINFTLDGGGTTVPIYEYGVTTGSHVGTGLDYVNDALGSLQSGYKVYSELSDFSDLSQESDVGTIGVLAGLVPSWFPVAGTAAKVLGFLVGKGRSTGSKNLIGYNHNFEFQASGTLGTTGNYSIPHFYTPGAFYNYQNPQANRTVYDNPLGIMQVLETPTVEIAVKTEGTYHQTGEFDETITRKYRYTGNLKYAINENAGISDVPIRLMGALLWVDCEGNEITDGFHSTPVINLRCLEDYTVELEGTEINYLNSQGEMIKETYGVDCERKPQLQIVAVLESSLPEFDGEILFSSRYDVEVISNDFENLPVNPYEGLGADAIFAVCNPPPPLPIAEHMLRAFCQNTYDPSFRSNLTSQPAGVIEDASLKFPSKATGVGVFPNPVEDYFNFSFPLEWDIQKVNIQLMDMNGKVLLNWSKVEAIPGASITLKKGVAELPSGQYYLRVISVDDVVSYPFIKN